MKLKGRRPGKAEAFVVFERPTGNVVFKLSAVLNRSDFNKIYPPPVPPKRRMRGEAETFNTNDPRYIEALAVRNKAETCWLIMETLKDTEELEWEKVKADEPGTWHLWQEELAESGLSDGEINHLCNEIAAVNSLSEARLEKARQSFLLGQAEETLSNLLSQNSEPPTT